MKRVIILLQLQIYLTKCTIDVDASQYVYIADHLTPEECRRLFASLHFVSYDLPAALTAAKDIVPKDVPCFELLIKWNGGDEKWEGRGKTHAEVEHRLRQVGRYDLADWLGEAVFQRLVADVNKALEDVPDSDDNDNIINNKIFRDKSTVDEDEVWTIFDTILWAAWFVLLAGTIATICRLIYFTLCKPAARRGNTEEAVDLLSISSGGSGQDLNNENEEGNVDLENVKCDEEDDDDD